MKAPSDSKKVHQHPLATLWVDDDGVLHKISKNTPRTLDNVKDLYSEIKRTIKGKKVCAIIEVSNETASDRAVLDFLKQEIPQVFSAVAFLANTPTGLMTGLLTSVLTPAHVPTAVFKDENEAKVWFRDHLHLC
jgi:hypothetical protein